MNNQRGQPFDPSALERAAAALRELNQSPHAQKALDAMIKTEEAKAAQFMDKAKQREIEKVKIEGQERRVNLDKQKETSIQIHEHNDKLERQRLKDKLREQEESSDRMRNQQEQSVKHQEEIRRETIAFQIKKQFESEEKKLKLQSQLQADNYRKNFDLLLKQKEAKAIQERLTRQVVHQTYLSNIKDGANYLLNEKSAIITFAKYTLFVSGAYFASKYGLGVIFRQIESQLNKPKLVRETSRHSWSTLPRLPFNLFSKSSSQKKRDIFEKIILNDHLEQTLQTLSAGLINKKQHFAPLRNFLFYGPPGTGKTLFAKLLAEHSGLHYAVVSGGDIEKLGAQASGEIDKLFTWARATKQGTILFIDEADAVFYKRGIVTSSIANSLATFLAQTSGPSHKVSLILASNLPQELDKAALDRMDQVIEFDYQELKQRQLMLEKGFIRICQPISILFMFKNPSLWINSPFEIKNKLVESDLTEFATRLDKFSARQIDKFIISVYDECFANQSYLTKELVEKVLKNSQKEKILRDKWIN